MSNIKTLSLILSVGTTLAAGHAGAKVNLSSSAAATNAMLNISGTVSNLPNQVVASGKGPAGYNSAPPAVASVSKSISFSVVTLTASGGNLVSTAYSKGVVSGAGSATAKSSVGTFDVTVASPLGKENVVATGPVTSTSTYSITKAGKVTTAGTTTISNLVISSKLLGIPKTTISGTYDKTKPNVIAYQNAKKTLTIYVNAQTATKTGGIAVEAIDMHFANFTVPVVNKTITGDIVVGVSTAD